MKVIFTGKENYNVKLEDDSSYKVIIVDNAETIKVSLATTSF